MSGIIWRPVLALLTRRPALRLLVGLMLGILACVDRPALIAGTAALMAGLILRRVAAPLYAEVAGPVAVALLLPAGAVVAVVGAWWSLAASVAAIIGGLLIAGPALPVIAGPVAVVMSQSAAAMVRLPVAIAGIAALAWLGRDLPMGWLLVPLLVVLADLTGDALRLSAAWGCGAAALSLAALLGVPSVGWPSLVLAVSALLLAAWPPGLRWWWPAPVLALGAVIIGLASGTIAAGAGLVAGVVAWAVWRALPDAGGPAWWTLPPDWRWFAWGKLCLDPVYAQLRDDARPWGRVLDAGCGFGLGAVVAAARPGTASWHGLDLDHGKLLAAARVCGRLAIPCRLDAARLPAGDIGTYDTVLALDLLHYWPAEGQAELLAWLAARLATDGRLWLRDGVADGVASGRVVAGERFTTAIGLNPAGPLHFLMQAALERLLTDAGLEIRSCRPSGAANVLWELRRLA